MLDKQYNNIVRLIFHSLLVFNLEWNDTIINMILTVYLFQIQWASTESQIEDCLMKGREKVRDTLCKTAQVKINLNLHMWGWFCIV